MKLQLDTQAKTIKFEESEKLGKLVAIIQKMLPDDEWKDYTLIPQIITNWANPIIVQRWDDYPWVRPSWNQNVIPEITCYNLEVK
jgi:hypothetical protein